MTIQATADAELELGADVGPPVPERRRHSAWRALLAPKIAAGLGIIAFFVLLAIFGPLIDRTNPSTLSSAVLQAPSVHHLLGTTESGQDVLAQLIVGARVSLLVGFVAGAIATAFSLLVGLLSGYLGGVSDDLLSTLSNIFLVIPTLPLVIVLAGYLPNKGALSVAIVISVSGWAWGARVQRAQTLSIRRRDFIEAARIAGESTMRIILFEILPNEWAIVATNFLFTVIFAILTEAALAFLGLANVSEWSWGTMLYWAQTDSALQVGAWWWFVPPGLCIALVGTGLALVNFGIDEFVNPRLRVAGIATRSAAKQARRQAIVDHRGGSRRLRALGEARAVRRRSSGVGDQ
jgi:peptide/nickel transport system permease protein